MTTWTKVTKSAGTSWTAIQKKSNTHSGEVQGNPIGLLLAYTYTFSNSTSWTDITKASGTTWTKITKAT